MWEKVDDRLVFVWLEKRGNDKVVVIVVIIF